MALVSGSGWFRPKETVISGGLGAIGVMIFYQTRSGSADSLALCSAVRLYLAESEWNLRKGRAAGNFFRKLLLYRDIA